MVFPALVLASPFATGFAIDLKLAGTTHGLGWATSEALRTSIAELKKISFKVFIMIWF
jgi:hypothetical protein